MSFVAECEQCGVIERGEFEGVGDAAEDHEQFHDVKISHVPADVEAAVGELETLGDVSEEIGVTRGRARTITVALDCYGDVKDLPAGGR